VVNLVARLQARVVNLVARRQVPMMMVPMMMVGVLRLMMMPRLMTPGGLTDGLRVVMLDGLGATTTTRLLQARAVNLVARARVVNLVARRQVPMMMVPMMMPRLMDGPVEEMKAGLPQTTPGQVPQTMDHLPPARAVNLAVGLESQERVLAVREMMMPRLMMDGPVEEMKAGLPQTTPGQVPQTMRHRPQARAASQAQAASLARVPSLAQMMTAPMMVGRVQGILSARPSPNSSSVSTQIAPSTKEYWHP